MNQPTITPIRRKLSFPFGYHPKRHDSQTCIITCSAASKTMTPRSIAQTLMVAIAYTVLPACAGVFTQRLHPTEGGPPSVLGTIPGVTGMQIHIVELAIGGDATDVSGPVQFSVSGGGLSFSWSAGQSEFLTAATYTLDPTPVQGWPYAGFTYASVSHLADVGASVTVQFDFTVDNDGWCTYATDSLGTFFDDSALRGSGSARAWVRYEYLPRLNVAVIGPTVSIAWPIAATNFLLEASSTLSSNSPWIGVTATQEVAGAYLVVTEPAVEARRFYRLVRPP